MLIVQSRNGVPVRLTKERWGHITRRHPEMSLMQQQVLQTVEEPDQIQEGDFGVLIAVRLYPTTPLTRKHVVVAHREISGIDGFVLTAYLATRVSDRRGIIWQR